MADYNYACKEDGEHLAKAIGRDLAVSTKYSIEVCNYIRGKPIDRAKQMLQDAVDMKVPIPLKRFTNGPGHKKGNLGSGRFICKTAQMVLDLVSSAESNAKNKGLNTKQLIVKSILAQKASTPMHFGRQRRRMMKRTHIEVVLQEKETKEVAKETKKKPVKPTPKTQPKQTQQPKPTQPTQSTQPKVQEPAPKKEAAKPKPVTPQPPQVQAAEPAKPQPQEKQPTGDGQK